MIDIELEPNLFRAIGGAVHFPIGPVSPWGREETALTTDQRTSLANLGILDGAGMIAPDFESTLKALANATGSSTLRVSGAAGSLQHASLAPSKRVPIGLTVTSRETIRVQDPAPTTKIFDVVERLFGRGQLQTIDLSLELDPRDAFVLAAIIDGQRRRLFSELGAGGDALGGPVSLDELRGGLGQPPSSPFWMVNVVARAWGADPDLPADGLSSALTRLADQGHIEADGSTVVLAGRCAGLAERFLTLGFLLELENIHPQPGATNVLERADLFCFQTSISDLLTIERVHDLVRIETVCADQLLGYVDRLLRSPDPGASPFVAAHVVLPGGLAPTWVAPNTTSESLAGVPSGTEVQLLTETGGWAEVASTDGWLGWLDRRWLADLPVQPQLS